MAEPTRGKAKSADQIAREYFDELFIEMRHFDAVVPDTTMELYGHSFRTPVMTAALSHLKGSGEGADGMVQMAEGAKRAGAVTWVGMTTNEQFAAIARVGTPTIRIIKPYADESCVRSRIEQAEELGALAVGMDLDHALDGKGRPCDVMGNPMRPRTLKEIEQYCRSTPLPFIIKGVLSASDAKKCVSAGARGIVVSHHHGLIPSAVPPMMALPEILGAVGGQFPVFIDCGFSNGADVFKALALGAKAVGVGRALMPQIGREGSEGAAKVLNEITEELAGVMARTGCASLGSIDRSLLWTKSGTHLGA